MVDASGSTDLEGNSVPQGSHDPVEDIRLLEKEISFWIRGILEKGWEKAVRQAHMTGQSVVPIVHDRLTGLGVSEAQVLASIRDSGLPRTHAWDRRSCCASEPSEDTPSP